MEDNPPLQAPREDDAPGQDAPRNQNAPPGEVSEPEDVAGDPPCWAHLLDESGRLIENPD